MTTTTNVVSTGEGDNEITLEEELEHEKHLLEHTVTLQDVACGVDIVSPEMQWLKNCLPVFIQPRVDVNNRNHLIKVMYEFIYNDTVYGTICRLHIIYAGESSYESVNCNKLNRGATILYRSYNRKVYKRTSDINTIEYRDVDLSNNSKKPYLSIYTRDYSGEQTWAQGHRGNLCSWISFMNHYKKQLKIESLTLHNKTFRPFIYTNTNNHMMGEVDNNPEMEKCWWFNYAVQPGNGEDADDYSKHHIPTKFNFYSCCCFWRATNGGGYGDRVTHNDGVHSGDSYYLHEDEVDSVILTQPTSV